MEPSLIAALTTMTALLSGLMLTLWRLQERNTGSRFDAVDARFDALAGQTDARFNGMQGQIDARFDGMQGQIDGVRQEVRSLEKLMDTKLSSLEATLGTRIGALEADMTLVKAHLIGPAA